MNYLAKDKIHLVDYSKHGVLYEWFSNIVSKYGNKTALISDSRSISFNEAKYIVDDVIRLLTDNQVRPGDRILACSENGFFMPLIALACSKMRATIIPISPSLQSEQIKNVLRVAKPNIVVSSRKANAKLNEALDREFNQKTLHVVFNSSHDFETHCVFGEKELITNDNNPSLDYNTPYTFIMNFTSGSTGDPKPVLISEAAKICRLKDGTIKLFSLNEHDRILITTPQYHSLGFRQSILPLVLGGTGIILDRFSPQSWLASSEKYNVTFCIAVSSQLAQLVKLIAENNKKINRSIKKIVSSSAPLDISTRQNCLKYFSCDIFEVYGLSETGIATCKKLCKGQSQDNSVGIPLNSLSLKLFDRDKNSFIETTNSIGEVAINCNSRFHGYNNNFVFPNSHFFQNHFLTGDLGYFDVRGELHFAGRTKEVIQNSGINVYPHDIETLVKKFPDITDAYVFGVSEQNSTEKIVLLYTTSAEIDENSMIRFLFNNLAHWQLPKYYKKIEHFTFNQIGKIDRQGMKNQFLSEFLGEI